MNRAAWLLAWLLAAAATAADGAWYLRCPAALVWHVPGRSFQRRRVEDHGHATDLLVELRVADGALGERAWCRNQAKPGAWAPAAVRSVELGEDRLAVELDLALPSVASPPGGALLGGAVHLRLELVRGADGAWTGTYRGTCRQTFDPADVDRLRRLNQALQIDAELQNPTPELVARSLEAWIADGETAGAVAVARHPLPARCPAPAAGTGHPRLLFTREELPAIRRRLATPEGERYLAAIRGLLDDAYEHGFGFHMPHADHSMHPLWAAAEGFLYQLDGDPERLERARRWTWTGMYASLPNMNQWRQCHRIMGVALAYDLCAEGWDPAFRQDVYNYLLEKARAFTRREDIYDPLNVAGRFGYGGQTRSFIGRSGDGYKYLAAAGLAALAIAGDEPPIYRPPDPDGARPIAPEPERPPAGVPVVDFRGEMFDTWLINGPFERAAEDPLASLGGFAAARPVPGSVVTVAGVDLDFRYYHPCGTMGRARGPHIYPRNCAQYWTKSTGNGYWPGRKVKAGYGRGGDRICLYTVWHNRSEQLVQAFPNYYWQSRGVRMWLAGAEVEDAEIVRVAPGYYPVMCDIPVTGGYSNQAPHLRWYSREHYAEQMARYRECRALFAGEHPGRLLAETAAREIRRQLLEEVGEGGWGAFGYTETLLPFLHAYRRSTGRDLAADTGLARVTPIVVAERNFGPAVRGLHLAQSVPFLREEDRGTARWWLQRYSLRTRRPLEYVVAICAIDPAVEPTSPIGRFPRAFHLPDHGVHLFYNTLRRKGLDEWREDPDREACRIALHAGGRRFGHPAGELGLALAGLRGGRHGSGWLVSRGRDHIEARLEATAPWAEGFFPERRARRRHLDLAADGSGTASYELTGFRPGRIYTDDNGRRRLRLAPQPLPGTAILRALLVDYSGDCGAPILVVIADRFRGFTRIVPKTTQLRSLCVYSRHGIHDNPKAHPEPPDGAALTWRHERRPYSGCRIRVFSDRELVLRELPRGDLRPRSLLRWTVDGTAAERDRSATAILDRAWRVSGGDWDPAVLAELERLAHADLASEPLAPGQERPGDVVIYSVIALGRGEAPEIRANGPGVEKLIRVGEVAVGFDGTRLERRR